MVAMVWKFGIALGVMAILVASVGCATPTMRYVEAIDSSSDSVKFLYSQKTDEDYWEQGIIECRLEGDELTECRRLEVEYR
jgi:hypothetical protein